jgi:lycopene cyclase domain-containing protein
MFGHATYLFWLAACLLAPILLLLLRWRARFWPRRRALGWVLLGALVGGWAWDWASVNLGIWRFAPANILGLWLGGLPLEEWLWIVGVTLMFSLLTIVLIEAGPA